MSHSIYMGYAALQSRIDALEVLSNNLANLQAPGFKQNKFYFQVQNSLQDESLTQLGSAINGPIVKTLNQADFSGGSLTETGNSLDLALMGDGFFSVRTPEGTRYTRNGDFSLDGQGRLVSANGDFVLAQDSRGDQVLTLPPGELNVSSNGQVSVNGIVLGTLKIVTFQDLSKLVPVGASLFRTPDGVDGIPPTSLNVAQGFIEQANVNPVKAVTDMITLMRSFEMLSQAVRSMTRDVDSRLINELAKP